MVGACDNSSVLAIPASSRSTSRHGRGKCLPHFCRVKTRLVSRFEILRLSMDSERPP